MLKYDELKHGKLYLVGNEEDKVHNIVIFDRIDTCYYRDSQRLPLGEGDVYWKYWEEIEGELNDHIIYAIEHDYEIDEDVIDEFLTSLNVKTFSDMSFDGAWYHYTYFKCNGNYYYYEDDYAPVIKKCNKEVIENKLHGLISEKVDIANDIDYLYKVLEGEGD